VCSCKHDCTQCGLSKLFTVDIDTKETSWEIINYESNEQVMQHNKDDTDTKSSYSKSQCVSEGGYIFVVHESLHDKSGYEVTIGDQRKLSGGYLQNSRTHFFLVSDKPRRLRGSENMSQ